MTFLLFFFFLFPAWTRVFLSHPVAFFLFLTFGSAAFLLLCFASCLSSFISHSFLSFVAFIFFSFAVLFFRFSHLLFLFCRRSKRGWASLEIWAAAWVAAWGERRCLIQGAATEWKRHGKAAAARVSKGQQLRRGFVDWTRLGIFELIGLLLQRMNWRCGMDGEGGDGDGHGAAAWSLSIFLFPFSVALSLKSFSSILAASFSSYFFSVLQFGLNPWVWMERKSR